MNDDAAIETQPPEFQPEQLYGRKEREEQDLSSNPPMTQHKSEVKRLNAFTQKL